MPTDRTRQRTGPKPQTLAARFWPKVHTGDPAECWPWTASCYPNGYGSFGKGGHSDGSTYAHRVVWELTNGPIPDGMFVCHRCDNPPCCNPAHLFLDTHDGNMADMIRKGRSPRGENKWNALMDEAKVRDVHRLYDDGWTGLAIAAYFGVTRGCITDILRGKTWPHLATIHERRKPGPKPLA